MGKCAILEGEFCGNQSIVGVTSESEIDDYLLFLMIKDSMNELLMLQELPSLTSIKMTSLNMR